LAEQKECSRTTDDQTDDRTVAQTAAEGDAKTPELARKDSGLFVEDSELLRRLGIPEKIGYRALAKLDRDERSDFPQKNAFLEAATLLAGSYRFSRRDMPTKVLASHRHPG
jgi:hypothetical protein